MSEVFNQVANQALPLGGAFLWAKVCKVYNRVCTPIAHAQANGGAVFSQSVHGLHTF